MLSAPTGVKRNAEYNKPGFVCNSFLETFCNLERGLQAAEARYRLGGGFSTALIVCTRRCGLKAPEGRAPARTH
jgi:hypothetical protein